MTNVFGTPGKGDLRRRLFQIGVNTLEKEGWHVERISGFGKSSVRRIRRGAEVRVVSIRTTQDTSIAFPRNTSDKGWVTLSDVDAVVAVSVDDADAPRHAQVHMIDGNEMRDRFDRAYKARLAAGHSIPLGRGVWVPLYLPDATTPPSQVGAGAGLDNPPIARVPLRAEKPRTANVPESADKEEVDVGKSELEVANAEERPLTISEAKRRLALSLGVDPSNIKITVEA